MSRLAVSRVLVVLSCHVESGTVRERTISFDRRHVEGVTQTMPRIVEFADQERVPLALHMTPQALRVNPTDTSGLPTGLHVHPQDDVLRNRLGDAVDLDSDGLASYSGADQSRILSAAVDTFTDATGRRPTLFVAGNWSENRDTVRLLEAAGIRRDGSALPGYASSCADWRRLPRLAQPYRPNRDDPQVPGDSALTCIPVFRGFWGDYLSPENLHYLGARYFMAALTEAAVGGARVVHIYFHSPMALDPFFLSAFQEVVDFARDRIGARFVSPEEVEADIGPAPKPFPPAYLAYLDATMAKSLFVRRFPRFQRG